MLGYLRAPEQRRHQMRVQRSHGRRNIHYHQKSDVLVLNYTLSFMFFFRCPTYYIRLKI